MAKTISISYTDDDKNGKSLKAQPYKTVDRNKSSEGFDVTVIPSGHSADIDLGDADGVDFSFEQPADEEQAGDAGEQDEQQKDAA